LLLSGLWVNSKPTSYTLSSGGGVKTVYVWAANGNGTVKKNKVYWAVITRQVPPVLGSWITPTALTYQSAASYNFSWNAATVSSGPPLATPNTYQLEFFNSLNCLGLPDRLAGTGEG
jgi:hypothetical protein